MTITTTAALAFCLLLAALGVFQLALAAGAPWGRFAWGGAERVLSPRRRAASVVAVALYVVFAGTLLAATGTLTSGLPRLVVVIAAWVVVGYLALGTVMNALSRSPQERWTMTPVSAVLVLCGAVALLG